MILLGNRRPDYYLQYHAEQILGFIQNDVQRSITVIRLKFYHRKDLEYSFFTMFESRRK
jgi:hypothetical protein